MKLNNKGFTVIELLASFALTMLIVVLLFEVVIELKDVFVETSLKTAIQNRSAIVSKNINNLFTEDGTSDVYCTDEQTCIINGKTVALDSGNNQIKIDNQAYPMPDTIVLMPSSTLSNGCSITEDHLYQCFLNVQLYLDSDSLAQVYRYNTTYYYLSTTN